MAPDIIKLKISVTIANFKSLQNIWNLILIYEIYVITQKP